MWEISISGYDPLVRHSIIIECTPCDHNQGSTTELKSVALGVVLAFAWEFIRRGHPSKIREKTDSLLQPNIKHPRDKAQSRNPIHETVIYRQLFYLSIF